MPNLCLQTRVPCDNNCYCYYKHLCCGHRLASINLLMHKNALPFATCVVTCHQITGRECCYEDTEDFSRRLLHVALCDLHYVAILY